MRPPVGNDPTVLVLQHWMPPVAVIRHYSQACLMEAENGKGWWDFSVT